jgi:tetratricopeptide (TPR) repeat protein
LAQAWHYGLLAQYEVANFQGEVHYAMCRYRAAIAQFETALTLAKEVGHADGIAKTSNNLGRIHTTIGEIDVAKAHFGEAEVIYRRIGKVTAIDGMRINRAFLCNLTGAYAEAVTTLQRFLAEKAAANEALSPLMTALLHQNLAEAYLGLGDLAQAETAVQQAIDQEEIHVLPDALRTHGEIKLQQGLPAAAERLIRHALDLLGQSETPDEYLAGYAWRALMRVYLAVGDAEKATAAHQRAIDCFTAINLPNEIERTTGLDQKVARAN